MDEKEAEARPLMGTIFLVIYRAVETYFVIASGQGCELLLQVTSSSSGCSLCLCYDVD